MQQFLRWRRIAIVQPPFRGLSRSHIEQPPFRGLSRSHIEQPPLRNLRSSLRSETLLSPPLQSPSPLRVATRFEGESPDAA